jgi:excinuclease ABC subunit B
MKFELHSDFQATGDQPDAIAKLVEGIQRGDKHQVLLGATGTGKSLGQAEPVFVVEQIDGRRQARVLPIGELVDGLFRDHPAAIWLEGDSQVLETAGLPGQYFTQAFDPGTCQVDLFPVSSFTRHVPPAAMYRLETACGRAATLTGDHNLYVLRDGHLQLIETADARPSDLIPLPESLLATAATVNDDVGLPEPLTVGGGARGRERTAVAAQLGRSREAVAAGSPSRDHLTAAQLPAQVWHAIGQYLALGAEREAAAGGQAAPVLQLGRLCGRVPKVRHLPESWPNLPNPALVHLLRGFFDAAGSFAAANEIVADVASPRLASDLGYALLRFGIWARVIPLGNPRAPARYRLTVAGQADLRRFNHDIRFGDPEKQEQLAEKLLEPDRLEFDVLPIAGPELRRLRQGVRLSAAALAATSKLPLESVQAFECGALAPDRVSVLRLLVALACQAQATEHFATAWWQAWDELHALSRLRWTLITAVEPVDYRERFVYDLSVPGAENFLAGSGGFFVHNTFTIANVVAQVQKPTLVMAHNKTLAAQLYAEFKEFFPKNAVEYFVSYYDYYQPEAYVARHDLYIEKETEINEEIDRLRLAATAALLSRRDVLIVSSVSCIYGLGSPDAWRKYMVHLKVGETFRRTTLLRQLVTIQYERNDVEVKIGVFRVRGDTLEISPIGQNNAFRIAFFGDEIERIAEYDMVTGEILRDHPDLDIFPAKHFITEEDKLRAAIHDIEQELEERVAYFKKNEMLLEAQRIEQRTRYDLEMLREVGYCSGIENYSRPLDQRPPGSPPTTLIDYFPSDFLLCLDESHMTVPQIGGMYGGDRSRKEELVKYGFRLPSALDNRPLSFDEFQERTGQVIYTSATPSKYELGRANQVVQQIIRPTGLVDPQVEVRPTKGQIDDLVGEIRARVGRGERVLVTTLTKRMAEDLADYLMELGIKVHYLHSEIETFERIEILRDLRLGVFDVVVGINLLREGLDLPEVSLVAILDADKEGFLRSGTSLVQTIGRAARHVNGRVLMYADKMTDSMRFALDETNRRRAVQVSYNNEHHIVPAGIVKSVRDITSRLRAVAEEPAEYRTAPVQQLPKDELKRIIKELEKQMKESAQQLEFEKAALLRDQIFELRQSLVERDTTIPEWQRAQKLAEIEK